MIEVGSHHFAIPSELVSISIKHQQWPTQEEKQSGTFSSLA